MALILQYKLFPDFRGWLVDIRLKLFLFIIFVGFRCFAQLDSPIVNDLVMQTDRPTLQDVIKALNMKPGQPIFRLDDTKSQQKISELKKYVIRDLPKFAVSLEYFYPNGQYAFLGRDASGAADLLEAFYLSIGLKDRVLRLRSSGDSLAGTEYMLDPQKIMADFLRTNGAPLDTNDLENERPYVIVDATSLGPKSQSTLLASAGIYELKSRGYKIKDIYPKFAVVDISKRADLEITDREELFAAQRRSKDILYSDTIVSNLAKKFSYNNVQPLWHKTFLELRYTGPKTVVAKPGALEKEEYRRKTIRNMLMIFQLMSDRDVIEAVKVEALKRGVSFKSIVKYTEPQKKIKVKDKPETLSAADLYKEMSSSLTYSANRISKENQLELIREKFSKEKNFKYAYLSLLIAALKDNAVSFNQFCKLLAESFDLGKLPIKRDSEFSKFFMEKAQANPDLMRALEVAEFIVAPLKYTKKLIKNGDIDRIREYYIQFGQNREESDRRFGTYGSIMLNEIKNSEYYEDVFKSLDNADFFELQKALIVQMPATSVFKLADILLSLPTSVRRDELLNYFMQNPYVVINSSELGEKWSQIVAVADLDTLKKLTYSYKYNADFETYDNPKLNLIKRALAYGVDTKRDKILEEGYLRLQRPPSRFSCRNIVQSALKILKR